VADDNDHALESGEEQGLDRSLDEREPAQPEQCLRAPAGHLAHPVRATCGEDHADGGWACDVGLRTERRLGDAVRLSRPLHLLRGHFSDHSSLTTSDPVVREM